VRKKFARRFRWPEIASSLPSTSTDPEVGGENPATAFSNVDFPHPGDRVHQDGEEGAEGDEEDSGGVPQAEPEDADYRRFQGTLDDLFGPEPLFFESFFPPAD
jgi:hypothetical protein